MRRPRSLAGRVTLAAVAAVGAALLIAGVTVVVAAGRSDRDALDREIEGLVQARAGPAQPGFAGVSWPECEADAADRLQDPRLALGL